MFTCLFYFFYLLFLMTLDYSVVELVLYKWADSHGVPTYICIMFNWMLRPLLLAAATYGWPWHSNPINNQIKLSIELCSNNNTKKKYFNSLIVIWGSYGENIWLSNCCQSICLMSALMLHTVLYALYPLVAFYDINRSMWNGPILTSDVYIFFLFQIEWRDPWLIALLSFHILVTLTCFTTRNYGNFQILLFIILCKYNHIYLIFYTHRSSNRNTKG